jgi:hypothetical protein
LQERMIGTEIFGRLVDYDMANDAVVRVSATEVRTGLTSYDGRQPAPALVRIELPTGSCEPKFHFATGRGGRSVG